MAHLMKFGQLPLMRRCLWNHVNKVTRTISTSKNNKDSASTTEEVCSPTRNWVSYGFDYNSEKEDTDAHHATFFFSVTLCLVLGGFMWAYAPDVHMRDWAQREAFLELRRREKMNQPLIDPDFISPDNINLPTEEELCDVEIII